MGRTKRLFIYGVVQGVGFRPTVFRIAKEMAAKGYVRNNGSNVEIVLDKDHETFLSRLKAELPPLARLDTIRTVDFDGKFKYDDFSILKSTQGSRDAPIPPDVALCDDCLKEMFDPNDRRYGYPFTNCTNCGARFSIIMDMPYDRPKTAMRDFDLCRACIKEYEDPTNRRFHAQTISCGSEGLRYILYDGNGAATKTKDPISEFSKLIDGGDLGVIKGWNGMHITSILERIPDLRKWYKRPSKPFAVMVRNLDVARRYAKVGDFEAGLLTSRERPIVVLERKESTPEDIAPGLGNIGLFLPYSGVHHLIFKALKSDALVMTSANPAGDPMLIDNKEALGIGLDWYLLHNRQIINRVDDTILIPFEGRRLMIRKSRGFTPLSLPVDHQSTILSVGAERNVNSSISKAGRLYTSQYIGHASNYNVSLFLEHGTRYLMGLLGIKDVDAVVMDLHPQYSTRSFAKVMAEKFGSPVYEVQHHFAHATSLMVDNGIKETIVCLTLDGVGYGIDGMAWGGEVLVNDLSEFRRVATLQEIPLIGGDAAILDPKRMVFAIREILGLENTDIDESKAKVFRKLMESSVRTTSFGRVLDALSFWLGICTERSYDGEPAMRIEPFLAKGEPSFIDEFEASVKGSSLAIIQTVPMFASLEELLCERERGTKDIADLAHSYIKVLLEKMVELAALSAERVGSRYIGLTGGVSYNLPITRMVKESVERRGLTLLLHDNVPNGDGGISIGQNVVVGEDMK